MVESVKGNKITVCGIQEILSYRFIMMFLLLLRKEKQQLFLLFPKWHLFIDYLLFYYKAYIPK